SPHHEGRPGVQAHSVRSASGAAAALLLVILLWASNSILVKIVLREIDPLTLTWLRYVIAGLFYVPYAVLTRAEAPRYTWREGVMLVAAGIALVPVFNLTLYWALSYTTVANTALVGTAALFLATGWTHARTIADQAFAMSALGWVLVVAMALLVTIASNQLFAFGLQRVPAGVATAYSYLIPVFAAGGAWLFLGEPITKVVVVCGAVIAAGVYLINRA